MPWNSLCNSGWPQTHGDPPGTPFWMLRIQVWATILPLATFKSPSPLTYPTFCKNAEQIMLFICMFSELTIWYRITRLHAKPHLRRSEDNFQGQFFTFHHGLQGLNSGFWACEPRTFTCWAISLAEDSHFNPFLCICNRDKEQKHIGKIQWALEFVFTKNYHHFCFCYKMRSHTLAHGGLELII